MSVTHRTLFRCLTYYEVMAHQVVRLHHRASQVFRHKKNGVTTLRWFGLFEEKRLMLHTEEIQQRAFQ